MLCYAMLYFTILYYEILYYTVLYYRLLYYQLLCYTILHYIIDICLRLVCSSLPALLCRWVREAMQQISSHEQCRHHEGKEPEPGSLCADLVSIAHVVWSVNQSCISKGIWRHGIGSFVGSTTFEHYALPSHALTCSLLSQALRWPCVSSVACPSHLPFPKHVGQAYLVPTEPLLRNKTTPCTETQLYIWLNQ